MTTFKAKLILTIGMIALTSVMAQAKGHERPEMDATTKAAIDACASANNMPEPGTTRPTKEQHEAFKACLQSKNIELPPRPRHHHDDEQTGQKARDCEDKDEKDSATTE